MATKGTVKSAAYASFLVWAIACSSSNGSLEPASAGCGNGVLDSGEQCDGPAVPTCAQVTGDPLSQGVVSCLSCRFSIVGCSRGQAQPGNGGANGGGFPGNGGYAAGPPLTGQGGIIATNGGVQGSGGFPANGGFQASGGFPNSGGVQGDGGFPGSGGVPDTGGVTGTGGDPGTGGAATGGNTSTGPLGDLNALRQACVDAINGYRATLSLPPLTRATATVETCSDTGAQKDGTSGVAHGSSGDCPGMGAQDTCPGWNPSQYGGVENALKACLQSMWAEGEPAEGRASCISKYFAGDTACFLAHGHYLNMSSTDNTVLSCGFYLMPNGRVWMNQDFGR